MFWFRIENSVVRKFSHKVLLAQTKTYFKNFSQTRNKLFHHFLSKENPRVLNQQQPASNQIISSKAPSYIHLSLSTGNLNISRPVQSPHSPHSWPRSCVWTLLWIKEKLRRARCLYKAPNWKFPIFFSLSVSIKEEIRSRRRTKNRWKENLMEQPSDLIVVSMLRPRLANKFSRFVHCQYPFSRPTSRTRVGVEDEVEVRRTSLDSRNPKPAWIIASWKVHTLARWNLSPSSFHVLFLRI